MNCDREKYKFQKNKKKEFRFNKLQDAIYIHINFSINIINMV